MAPDTFRNRMQMLTKRGYAVLPLDQAVVRLEENTLPRNAAAITIDDGWLGVAQSAAEVLNSHDFAATVYVTTYYVEKETAVFNVLLPYLLWKSAVDVLDLKRLGEGLDGLVDLHNAEDCDKAIYHLIETGEKMTASDRQEFARRIAEALGVNWETIARKRIMHLLTFDDLRRIQSLGIDLQLHTHRHFGVKTLNDRALLINELTENRRQLGPVAKSPLVHYAYPSGAQHDRQLSWLEELGIVSATTTTPGSNKRGAHPLKLARLLDAECISPIRFEAELCGIVDVFRDVKKQLRKITRPAVSNHLQS